MEFVLSLLLRVDLIKPVSMSLHKSFLFRFERNLVGEGLTYYVCWIKLTTLNFWVHVKLFCRMVKLFGIGYT